MCVTFINKQNNTKNMKKQNRFIIEILYFVINILCLGLITYLLIMNYIIFEIFMALIFIQVLGSFFVLFFYLFHEKMKKLAKVLKFDFMTRFMEQPRMEGDFKKNWFQIHFSSRSYGEYWGLPRTYIKLQYKEKKEFDKAVLSKYKPYTLNSNFIDNVEYIKRPYKNYLLMRIKYYVLDKNKIKDLMDFLLKVAKEAEIKK